MAVDTNLSIFSELADFIVSRPTLEEVIAYRVSPSIQQHLDNLLDKNREEGLTPEEREELDHIIAMSHLMIFAKAKARLKLEGQE